MKMFKALRKCRSLVALALAVLFGATQVVFAGGITRFNGALVVGDSVQAPTLSATTSLRSVDLVVTDSLGVSRLVVGTTATTVDGIVTDSLGVARAFVGTDLTVADSIGADQLVVATYVKADSIDLTGAMTVDGDLFQTPISFTVLDPDSGDIFARIYAPYPLTLVSANVGYFAKAAEVCSVFVYSDADAIVKKVGVGSGATFTRNATGVDLNAAADTLYFKYWSPDTATEDTLMSFTLWVHPKND